MDKIREAGFVSLKDIIEEKAAVKDENGRITEKRVWFSSMRALIQGALSFVAFFEQIHKDGYVYGSNLADPFRISLTTGEMKEEAGPLLVRDGALLTAAALTAGTLPAAETAGTSDETAEPDPEVPSGTNHELPPGQDHEVLSGRNPEEPPAAMNQGMLSGKGRARIRWNEFLAPELVEAAASGEDLMFSVETDWYFMSVFLFEYFFHTGSPFEGKKMVNRCFLSPMEKELYRAREGQFCMDLGEVQNTPVKGIQDKLIQYWEEYPDLLHKMFQKAFMDGGNLTNLRPTETDWKQALVRMMMDYENCRCGFKGFSFRLREKENGILVCPRCGKCFYPLSDGLDRILIAEGKKLYACQTGKDPFDKDTVTGLIVENKRKKGLYGIKNVSKDLWRGTYPDGSIREIGQGAGIPIWDGMRLRFERGEDWTLRLIQPIELYTESEVEEDEQ